MQRNSLAAILPVLFFLLLGCAHVTNGDQALCVPLDGGCTYSANYGYRFDPNKLGSDLVIVTFSGGGLRATALAYGTLQTLSQIRSISQGGGSFLDRVNIISSVSGGSVTAGWYALNGRDGLSANDNKLQRFINNGVQTELLVNGLNPVALARYTFTPYQRSDVLSGVFANALYGDKTYATVAHQYEKANQPFVILNATDTGHETRFPFTQNRFDLICSDLTRYRLADAVTASADFPPVFSAVGLRNFSGTECPMEGSAPWRQEGPSVWIKNRLAPQSAQDILSNELIEVRAAREAQGYLCPDGFTNDETSICAGPSLSKNIYSDGRTLHLQDGGLADNLGVQSPLALEDSSIYGPGLYQRLSGSVSDSAIPYEKIRRVLFIVVNARADDNAGIDTSVYPPSIISTTLRIIDTSLDATILTTQDYLTAELEAINARRQGSKQGSVSSPTYRPLTQSGIVSYKTQPTLEVKIATIDFDMLVDQRCRRAFASIPTNWKLNPDAVEALQKLPAFLLTHSEELKDFLGDKWQLPSEPTDLYEICSKAERSLK